MQIRVISAVAAALIAITALVLYGASQATADTSAGTVGAANTHWASVRHQVTLTRAQVRAIAQAPHPYLDKACDGPLWVVPKGTRVLAGDHRALAVQVLCKYGSAGSPAEFGVYDVNGNQRYLLFSGRAFNLGRYWVSGGQSGHGVGTHAVTMTFQGFTSKDPMCCPSRLWKRTYQLGWSSFSSSSLVRVPVRH